MYNVYLLLLFQSTSLQDDHQSDSEDRSFYIYVLCSVISPAAKSPVHQEQNSYIQTSLQHSM